MSDVSAIEWTDATWNPVRGCSVVSPGCTHCYAMKFAHRYSGPGLAYEGLTKQTKGGPVWTGKVRLVPELLDWPLRKRKPLRIFVNSMSDLFHDDVPDDFIDRVFAVMALAYVHTFQVLTKRPERMRAYMATDRMTERGRAADDLLRFVLSDREKTRLANDMMGLDRLKKSGKFDEAPTDSCWRDAETILSSEVYSGNWPLPNVWLGVSVEDQARADERIPLLLQTPAAVRFISAEPLLGPIDMNCIEWHRHPGSDYFGALSRQRHPLDDAGLNGAALDWVIVGGESGPGARECRADWIRSIASECHAASVPCFVKQVQVFRCNECEWPYETMPEHAECACGGGRCRRVISKDPEDWAKDLRVREFPS